MSRFLRLFKTKAEYDACVGLDEPNVSYVEDVDKVFYRKETNIGSMIHGDNSQVLLDDGSEIDV